MRKSIRKSPAKAKKIESEEELRIINPNACGIDVGAESVFVCVPAGRDPQQVREFTAFTADLHQMAQWLKKCGVDTVAMESTGVYWIPVFEVLEQEGFNVHLVNAHHVKNVPGRKTDVCDSKWIQRLHAFGLLSGSFRPADHVVKLRAFMRHRSALFERAADQLNYAHKALQQLNIKLAQVLSDISGLTGTLIIEAIIRGERDPVRLASLKDVRCQSSKETIAKALEGNWREEHLFALAQAWEAYKFFHIQVTECEARIEKVIKAFEKVKTVEKSEERGKRKSKTSIKKSYNRSPFSFDMRTQLHSWAGVDLCVIPGINENIASKILTEIGTDMSRWKTKGHFSSWLALCPGNKVSGGKVLSGRTKPSKNRAREALRMAAYSLTFSDSYLGAYYRRMRAKHGAPKAITATAHKLAKIIYHMLKHQKEYEELGAAQFEKEHRERHLNSLRKKAREMGYELVTR